jgi:hypothetical protein
MKYRTHQDDEQITVEQVDEKGTVTGHMSTARNDFLYLQSAGVSNEVVLRMFNDGEVAPGGIFDHTAAAKHMAGKAVNWTGEHTPTGFVFVVAQ